VSVAVGNRPRFLVRQQF